MKIAIDGPSASGKSSVARLVAEALGFLYLDTGAMYRTVSAAALRLNVPTSSGSKLAEMLRLHWGKVSFSEEEIRTPAVTDAVSEVSAHREVRDFLIGIQREIAKSGDIVMDGRDIGTVVLPDAELKIYLDASPEVRAKRRALQSGREYEEELKSIQNRDRYDSTREIAPLKRSEDALLVDTTEMTLSETVEKIVSAARSLRSSESSKSSKSSKSSMPL